MTDSEDGQNWHSNKNWIKDVLSKSGTELMDISKTTNKNGAAKKVPKNTGKDIHNKMVYYQAAPLIVKSEQSSQAQFCTPLQSGSHTSTAQHQQQPQQQLQRNTNNNFKMQQQPQQSTSNIANLTNAPNHNFFANIKTELLTPNITLFAKSTSSLAIPPILTSNVNSSSIMATPAAVQSTSTAGGRRKTSGNKPQFKCEQCGMTFGSKSAHTSHTKSHKNGKLNMTGIARQMHAIEVNEAGIPLGIPKTPQINANNGSGDPYQCNVCQKTFAVPARLIRHYRTHTGERPFECEFCHKLFSVKENLQVHRRIHTKERPYKCDVCGRAFEHSGKLHRHMRIHTGERPHKCSVCEKTFIQSGQLVIHMRTHTGEKPYKCPVVGCGKGFTCSKQLKVHSRTHTGEKPYHCDICFRDFGYNHVLKLHRVQHYGSKCYKCTICEETFKSKKDMEMHIKGHAHELPDDEETVGGNGHASSSSSSSGETTSVPSPPRPRKTMVKVISKIKNPKQQRKRIVAAKTTIGMDASLGPLSPSSSRSTFSSTSSMASAAALRQSACSPASSVASLSLETDYHSHDSGLASTNNNRKVSSSAAATLNVFNQAAYIIEEMPTDLSVQQEQKSMSYPQEQELNQNNPVYQQQFSFIRHSPVPVYPQQQEQHPEPTETPTINPALVEAVGIASRRTLEPLEEQAALQMLQLHRSQKQPIQQQQQQQSQQPIQIHQQQFHDQIEIQPIYHTLSSGSPIPPQQQHPMHVVSEMSHYDDTREANELIEHYKRGELVRHGILGYAPVPKFESSLLNNEIIVRQVEAAIAPLRSSTESPERSSSPESDSMMMADRDVMTLPLRKRKLYMNEGPNEVPAPIPMEVTNESGSSNTDKGVRISSVIQFAKAS